MFDSVRMRLTLWYVCVLALVLVAFSIGVYVQVASSYYNRMDSGLRQVVKAIGAAIDRELAAGRSEQEAAHVAQDELLFPRQATAVYIDSGQIVNERPTKSGNTAPLPPLDAIPENDTYFFNDMTGERPGGVGRRVAVRRISSVISERTFIIAVSQPLERVTDELKEIRNIFYIAVPLALALAGVGGWFLARRSLAPVVVMSERARRIGAKNLEERLPVVNPRDELGRLASTFNELLARLGAAFAQQRRFMADASHELRTPLSVMRTASSVTLEREHRDESEYREALRIVGEQARRLTRIVEDMFTLARADAGHRALQRSEFYLDELLAESARAAAVLGARKGVEVALDDSAEAPFTGDEGLMRQMFLNLLDNAVKHTPQGGRVNARLEVRNGDYRVTVSDTGSGIPAEAQPHIFERFFRADKARARSEPGNGGGAGLGLSIAQWIAHAHGGDLKLQRSDARGSIFVASLPFRRGN